MATNRPRRRAGDANPPTHPPVTLRSPLDPTSGYLTAAHRYR
ncbi:hypothetical protein [Streptomyces europaeiscabiei]|nr:hypothetical protein [Streptomyces europaeiscabiei]MDX3635433.1 hypothetical protein [Streptomyces europaeiscabiei]MDX3653664.1 hypothetical protein [Streptomyces europaeiscabiei]